MALDYGDVTFGTLRIRYPGQSLP